jgi:flagellar FliJ protein
MITSQSERLRQIKETQIQHGRWRMLQIEAMIAEFDRMCIDLGQQIEAEEKRVHIEDQSHFAYPTFAKAARLRRANLQQSADALTLELIRLRENREAA